MRTSWKRLVWVLALVVALGGGSASAAGEAVVSGTFAGKADGAAVGVAVVAEKPAAEGQARTISVYVCNGTSLSVWLTGKTAGNVADLKSADARFGVHVELTAQTANGKFGISGGSGFRFTVPRALGVAGLFDVNVIATGTLRGRSTTGGTLTGRVGAGGKLPARGTVVATASAGGRQVKLTALGRHLTAGAYRWIVLSNGKVWGANRLGPIRGGIGGLGNLRLTGRQSRPPGVVRISAGSAGQKGYDDEKCGQLADKWNKFFGIWVRALNRGDRVTAKDAAQIADDTYGEMSDHCVVVERA